MGELAKVDGLTVRQQAYVDAILAGAEERDALTLAGYSQDTSPTSVSGSRSVQRALEVACEARLRGPLRAKALKAIEELLDSKTPSATRFQAAKFIAEHSSQAEGSDKPLSEMTEAELMAVIEKAKEATKDASAARIIDVTPRNGA